MSRYSSYQLKWQQEKRAREARNPAPDKVQCQICGLWYRQVGSHIWQVHHLSAREYRKEYGFDVRRGQLAGDYLKLKSRQAFECGGVLNLESGAKYRFKKGQSGLGAYKRSEQTLQRLHDRGKSSN